MEAITFFEDNKSFFTLLHVLSVIAGMGSALTADILFNFFAKDKYLNQKEIKTSSLLSRIVWISLFCIILSGIALFLSDIAKYSESTKFLAKMSIVGILTFNGFILSKFVWSSVISKGFLVLRKYRGVRKVSFVCGMISVVSWIFACVLGILDKVGFSYLQIMSVYGFIIFCGAFVALFVEKKEFN